jgi:hypothetical protein
VYSGIKKGVSFVVAIAAGFAGHDILLNSVYNLPFSCLLQMFGAGRAALCQPSS